MFGAVVVRISSTIGDFHCVRESLSVPLTTGTPIAAPVSIVLDINEPTRHQLPRGLGLELVHHQSRCT